MNGKTSPPTRAPVHARFGEASPKLVARMLARQAAAGNSRWKLTAAVLSVVLLLAAGFSAGCRGGGKPTLSDLDGLGQLKARFNRDRGKPRIVLLVSPT